MKNSKIYEESATYEIGDKTVVISNSSSNGVHGAAVVINEIIVVNDLNIGQINESRQNLFGDKKPAVKFGDTVYVCQHKYRDQAYPYKCTELVPANVMADLAAGVKEPKPPGKDRTRHAKAAHNKPA